MCTCSSRSVLTKAISPEVGDETQQYLPSHGARTPRWADTLTINPLKQAYITFLGPHRANSLAHFFQDTLSIPDASWEDTVGELEVLKAYDNDVSDPIPALYEYLLDLYKYLSKMNVTNLDDLR
jgi:hypothetical protein